MRGQLNNNDTTQNKMRVSFSVDTAMSACEPNSDSEEHAVQCSGSSVFVQRNATKNEEDDDSGGTRWL